MRTLRLHAASAGPALSASTGGVALEQIVGIDIWGVIWRTNRLRQKACRAADVSSRNPLRATAHRARRSRRGTPQGAPDRDPLPSRSLGVLISFARGAESDLDQRAPLDGRDQKARRLRVRPNPRGDKSVAEGTLSPWDCGLSRTTEISSPQG